MRTRPVSERELASFAGLNILAFMTSAGWLPLGVYVDPLCKKHHALYFIPSALCSTISVSYGGDSQTFRTSKPEIPRQRLSRDW